MSAFFSNLVHGHPIIGFKSLFVKEDIMEIQKFESSPPKSYYVKIAGGVGRKTLLKDVRALYDSVPVAPADLKVQDCAFERSTPSEFLDQLIDQNDYCYCYAAGDFAKKIQAAIDDNPGSKSDVGNLYFCTYRSWEPDDPSLADILDGKFRKAWNTIQQRTDGLPVECTRCSEPLVLDEDDCCSKCQYEITVKKRPKNFTQYYKQICEYEKNSGKEVLERQEAA